MEIDFKSKIVLVTGGGRGIGHAISMSFAKAGAHVVVLENNDKVGEEIERSLNKEGSGEYINFDLSNTEESDSLVKDLYTKYGKLDVLINNARSGQRTLPLKETVDNIHSTASVTLYSPIMLSQAFINCNDGTGNDHPSIINISSIAAGYAGQESLSYHAFKSGLEGMTRYLAKHGGKNGVRVNAIRPGFIVQDEHIPRYMQDDNFEYRNKAEYVHPLGKIGTVDDVSNLSLFLASEASRYITGQVITVDGGLTIQDQWDLIIKSPYTK